jgi:hypothetical protein
MKTSKPSKLLTKSQRDAFASSLVVFRRVLRKQGFKPKFRVGSDKQGHGKIEMFGLPDEVFLAASILRRHI